MRRAAVGSKASGEAKGVLSADELRRMNAYWRACNYLCAGMLYLVQNPLLRKPLKPEHIKNRLLGHWGSDPGQSFTWVHLNRLIKKYDLNVIFISGPGHGAPATLSNCTMLTKMGLIRRRFVSGSGRCSGLGCDGKKKPRRDCLRRGFVWEVDTAG